MPASDTRISIGPDDNREHESQRSLPQSDQTTLPISDVSLSQVALRRKRSLAQSFSQRVVTEEPFMDPRESETSWGPSVGQTLRLEYRASQDTVKEDETDTSKSEWKLGNIRAHLGTFELLWFDLKTWFRRWRYKTWDNPFLFQYISFIECNFGSGIGALFFFTRWVIMLNVFLVIIWLLFVVIPMALNFDYSSINRSFAYRNLLDGQGPVAVSWIFYCAYKPQISADGFFLPDFHYHIGFAYLAMILFTFFGSLFIILRNMAIAQKPSVSTSLNKRYCFSFLLFTSWDFSITASDAATNLRKGFASVLKDNMFQAKADLKSTERGKLEKCQIFVRRFAAWILTLLLVGGGCAAITYLVLHVNFESDGEHMFVITPEGSDHKEDANLLQVFVTPVVFSFINLFIPFLLSKIPLIEKYKTGQAELSVTISRIFLLRMANLFTLIMSLYSLTLLSERLAVSGVCTGTVIGQEIYKLIILDTLIYTCAKLVVSYVFYFWKKEKKEFDIPSAVLVLIYRQALIWIGTLVCPVLPLVGAASNLVFFFLNYFIVKHTCKPPIKRWRQTRRTFFFMGVLLFTLFTVIVPVSIVIGSKTVELGATSEAGVSDGPFTGEFIPTSAYFTFANSIPIDWIKKVLIWLISNTVILPMFLILLSLLSYMKMRIAGERTHCLILQAELQQEREDNKKLIKKLQEVRLYGAMALKI